MIPKSILILGTDDAGAIENFFINGFKKCGINITTFEIARQYYVDIGKNGFNKVINKISPDFFCRDINRRLLEFLDKKKYDVILVFKGMQLFPETIKQLKDHAAIVANFNLDHPFKFLLSGSGNKNVLESIPFYDIHFSYSKKIVQQLKQAFKKDAFFIPFGYDDQTDVQHSADVSEYTNRILFIGAYDKRRAAYLDKLKSSEMDIYGNDKWQSRNIFHPYIRRAYQKKSLYGKEYINAIISATGIINILREQNLIEESHNMRSFEVPGYGGLLLSQRTSEQLEYFEEDKEAVYFGSAEELRSKMDYLIKNNSTVTAIKRAGHERAVRDNYSYDNRSKQLLACLNGYF
ncbi:MAG: glycosyltransferase [Chitinophagaceae bacterium]